VEYLSKQEKAIMLNEQGLKSLQEGQLEKAVNLFKEAIECHPNLAIPYGNLGMCYSNLGNYELAEQFYLKAIELDQTNIQFFTGLGSVYIETQQYEKAEMYLEKAKAIDPENMTYLTIFGGLLFASNRYKEAIDFHEELIRSEKVAKTDLHRDAEIHYRLAYSYIKLDKLEKGLEIAENYLQKSYIIEQPHFKTLFIQMKAKALAKMNKLVEVAILLQRALSETPRNVILLIELGDIHQSQQNYQMAITCYEKALEINPNFTHLKEIIEYLKKGLSI